MDPLGNTLTTHPNQTRWEISIELYPSSPFACIDNLDCQFDNGSDPAWTRTRTDGLPLLLTLITSHHRSHLLQGRLQWPSSVWDSPEIDTSKFWLDILSDTPGGSQWINYISLMGDYKVINWMCTSQWRAGYQTNTLLDPNKQCLKSKCSCRTIIEGESCVFIHYWLIIHQYISGYQKTQCNSGGILSCHPAAVKRIVHLQIHYYGI